MQTARSRNMLMPPHAKHIFNCLSMSFILYHIPSHKANHHRLDGSLVVHPVDRPVTIGQQTENHCRHFLHWPLAHRPCSYWQPRHGTSGMECGRILLFFIGFLLLAHIRPDPRRQSGLKRWVFGELLCAFRQQHLWDSETNALRLLGLFPIG